ncbi:hypothetical protein J3R30DRAFT_2186122 [Lentinula aciculospora]|uniref:Uncharacterized protein n=1 Tax=Lentinula aciculospora TaxID=153920 RepID=A0A9W9DR59_9AGAR|nr:hypothetical protein J3R30DRAFT_2186122 [Lentinula aciculospora]
MLLQDARLRLYEDQVILHAQTPKLMVGKLSKPDDLGWRWYQCTNTLQILLPPDTSIRYEVFLKMEQKSTTLPSSHATVQRNSQTRKGFVDQCLQSKPTYPVRGISPTMHRYALEPGFKCLNLDNIIAGEEIITASHYMTTFDVHLVPRSQLGLLGPVNEWGCSWVRLKEDTQVLLSADTTSQYHAFLRCSILSDIRCVGWEASVTNFTRACIDHAIYLGIYKGDRLYVLDRDMSGPALASVADVLRTHYYEIAENARLYAHFAPTDPFVRGSYTKSSPLPIVERHTKRRRSAKAGSILEPLVEMQEDVTDSGSEWGSESLTTVLGSTSSAENRSEKVRKSKLLDFRRTAKILSYGMPAQFCGRLIALVAQAL